MSLVAKRKRGHAARLPLPPFGARILEAVRRGEHPNVFITAGSDAWHRHEIRTERVVLPPGEDPTAFDWTFMRGLEPTIVGDDCPMPILEKLAWCLLRVGCPLVCLGYDDAEATAARPLDERVARGTVVRLRFFRHG